MGWAGRWLSSRHKSLFRRGASPSCNLLVAAAGILGTSEDGGLGGVQKRLTSLLHFVLQLTNLKPKPPWAFGTVVLEGVKKGSLLYYTLYYN